MRSTPLPEQRGSGDSSMPADPPKKPCRLWACSGQPAHEEHYVESDPLCVCGHAQRDHHDRADGCEVTVSQPGSTTYADDCMEFKPASLAEFDQLLDESSLGAPHVKAAAQTGSYVVVFVLPDGAVGTASVPPGVAVRIDDGQLVISARDRRPISITSVKTLKE